MPPRKKLKSSSSSSTASSSSPAAKKKSGSSSSASQLQHSQQQPSKFGIQHFFQRYTQQNVTPPTNNETAAETRAVEAVRARVVEGAAESPTSLGPKIPIVVPSSDSTSRNPKSGGGLVSESRNPWSRSYSGAAKYSGNHRTSDDLVTIEEDAEAEDNKGTAYVSPEASKFSPGMLIKQSQDDGSDVVTWKISPVNERLQAVSKHLPQVLKALADSSSNLKSLGMRPCSLIKNSPGPACKVSKWRSSPTQKTSELSANKVGKRLNQVQDTSFHGILSDANRTLASQQSPFRTPPSLSHCNERLANVRECNGVSDPQGFRQHKKALLELLDQVEDAISVESEPFCVNSTSFEIQNRNGNQMPLKADPQVKGAAMGPPRTVNKSSLNDNFLVLEVSEKHRAADSSGPQCPFKILRLLNEQSGEERAVCLWDEWFYSVVAPGDTVNVIGKFDGEGKCDVNHDNNLFVVHPDILVSGTRVAASFGCPRRTVLDERLKCNEHSTPALTGILLHQIFQAGLVKEHPSINFLEEYARVVLQKNIDSLYACGVDETEMLKTLVEAVPKLLNWIVRFKDSEDLKSPVIDFGSDHGSKELQIAEVIDIEEMAWAPRYGLKGMIDASVNVRVKSSKNVVDEKIMPLEFKTGKIPNGQSSMEHSAQVILYTLLMSERYLKHIDTGLLYYLQSDMTQGIMVMRSDVVGLIMRRNELANDILQASRMQQLPPMLRSPSMCRNCRHLDVCTIYHKVHGGNTESSGLGDLFDSHVNHLTTSHCAFLRHWDRLIDLEAKETQLAKIEMWRSHGRGVDHSSCLSSIVLDASDGLPHCKSLKDNRFIYRFVRQKGSSNEVLKSDEDTFKGSPYEANGLDSLLKSGDYVILTTEFGQQSIASGVVSDISHSHVCVSFTKCLRLPGIASSHEAKDLLQQVWRIEKDEFMTSFSVMRFNLVQLFLQSMQSSHLRKMIIDLEEPRFDSGSVFSQDPAISYVWSVKSLNVDQRRAILKILTAKDYALILGMPGTGKTSTMVHAVKALLIRGASILLTSYTNSAVDNLLIKLKAQGIDFLRIGRCEAVHEEVRANCFSAMDVHSVEDIRIRLDQVKVVAVTCLGITSPLLANKKFDVCIMDEAGQITLPVSLGPLMLTSIFVLVGDHYQLPPLVQSTEARENGMGISLFCRLSEAHPQAIAALQSQYRMCQGIMELSNALIYGERLRCGSSETANAKLKFTNLKSCSSWLKEILDPSRPVVFINTDMLPGFEAKDSKTVNNPVEAHIIVEVAEELIKNGIEGEDIGIITAYNSQANLIRSSMHSTFVEVHTIDKYQGRDKDCILVSFVRSTENPKNCSSSLLGDWHRMNVALTRAKKKLIMVGSCKTLSKFPLLKLLLEKVEEQSGILNVSRKDVNYQEKRGMLKRCSQFI